MVVVVSGRFPVPLRVRFQQPGENEVACALALLEQLIARLGRRYFDILVADALYLQAPFTQRFRQLGWRWVIILKKYQPESAATAERLMAGPPQGKPAHAKVELDHWYLPELYWPAADRAVPLLKSVRCCLRRQAVIRDKKFSPRQQRQTVKEIRTNYFAGNLELGSIPPLFLYELGRSRWRIDVEVFQTLTVDYHLKHATAHRPTAFPVRIMVRVPAYTLTLVFHHREVLSHPGPRTPTTLRQLARALRSPAPALDSS